MPKDEVLYVRGMRQSESDDMDENIWDDQYLNAAYDKANEMVNIDVAKRIAQSTNTVKKPEKPKSSSHKWKPAKASSKVKWTVGMPCRAVYEGDQIEYEAFILRIINDKECIVRFLGYDNSEIVAIDSMKPSHGKEAQQLQIEEGIEKEDETDREWGSERGTSPRNVDRSFQRKPKSKKKKRDSYPFMNGFQLPEMPPMPDISKLGNLFSMDMPMAPPPLPFASSSHMDCEDQAISSMLLSWYMSGYYTGLYEGRKRAEQHKKHRD